MSAQRATRDVLTELLNEMSHKHVSIDTGGQTIEGVVETFILISRNLTILVKVRRDDGKCTVANLARISAISVIE